MSQTTKISDRLRAFLKIPPRVTYLRGAIEHSNLGITRTTHFSDKSVSTISSKWSEVTAIHAFKRDVFAYDLLCVAITDPEGVIELDEEMEGWENLIEALPSYLPGTLSRADWWEKVAFPTFATNMTTLYSKESDPIRISELIAKS